MKKMVVMITVYDEGSKEKVMRAVASCSGITSINVESKEGNLMVSVIGDFDEMQILTKLKRKWRSAKMVTFGTYDPKKEAEAAAAAERKKKEESERATMDALYRSHHETPHCPIHHHSTVVCEHDHNGCVIL
ncbi:hypothetical protein CARUB_v10021383mg [Capsella rubella]|uniref:HMA domain-containing protein n=1 Tax=Capsella rubella TaxID=81985 RepID=R0GE32_9BRAS|nr:hypothetical protein CARUB_v10021383mg [Capsella rubella]